MSRDQFANQGSNAYDVNDIITTSQDDHGHSTNLRVHIPKPWAAILHQIANSDTWPEYGNVHAIVRDALYHRMHWISEQKGREQFPAVAQAVAIARAEAKIEVQDRTAESVDQLKKRIDKTLGDFLAEHQYEAVVEWVDEFAEETLPSIQEPWRTKLAGQLSTYKRRAEARW